MAGDVSYLNDEFSSRALFSFNFNFNGPFSVYTCTCTSLDYDRIVLTILVGLPPRNRLFRLSLRVRLSQM